MPQYIIQLTHILLSEKTRPRTPSYSMTSMSLTTTLISTNIIKEITECIGDIRCENSTIFLMLDLTSGFWQMQLGDDSQPLTAFTIPSKGNINGLHCPWV
jgi:hypothetical protein